MVEKFAQLDSYQIERIGDIAIAPTLVAASEPDALVLSVESLTDAHLVPLIWLKDNHPLPIIVFAKENASSALKAVVSAGVSTYIVDDVSVERLPVILELAVERFAQMETVNSELNETKKKLAERKLIEKAKGIVMRQNNCSESQAYTLMRKSAMNQGKPLAELASDIIVLFDNLLD